mgnify:CR=1 FL=1
MTKENNNLGELMDDVKILAITVIVIFILLKILFFKESITNIIKMEASFYYLFILPGFSLLYYWKKELSFLERFIIGFAVSLAVTSISSYYIGLLGINLNISSWMIPMLIIIAGLFAQVYKYEEKNEAISD